MKNPFHAIKNLRLFCASGYEKSKTNHEESSGHVAMMQF